MAHFSPAQLTDQPDGWPVTAKQLDCLEFYINTLAFITPHADIARVAKRANELGIELAIECGYFDWVAQRPDFKAPNPKGINDTPPASMQRGVGKITAQTEIAKIDPLLQAGGVPSYLNMDGPIRRLMHPGQDVGRFDIPGFTDINVVAAEIVDYLKEWRKSFPKIKFFELSNFPNWGWKGNTSYRNHGLANGDFYELLPPVLNAAKKAGVAFSGVTVDNPYEYAKGTAEHDSIMNYHLPAPTGEKDPMKIDWMTRILDIERFVKGQKLDFNLIVNSQGGNVSSEAFCSLTLKMIDEYRAIGGRPTRYIVQSWLKYPEKAVPESEMYTLAWLFKQVAARVR